MKLLQDIPEVPVLYVPGRFIQYQKPGSGPILQGILRDQLRRQHIIKIANVHKSVLSLNRPENRSRVGQDMV